MKVINNFLPKNQFEEIKSTILDRDFPWRIRNNMTDTDKNIYFTYGQIPMQRKKNYMRFILK